MEGHILAKDILPVLYEDEGDGHPSQETLQTVDMQCSTAASVDGKEKLEEVRWMSTGQTSPRSLPRKIDSTREDMYLNGIGIRLDWLVSIQVFAC